MQKKYWSYIPGQKSKQKVDLNNVIKYFVLDATLLMVYKKKTWNVNKAQELDQKIINYAERDFDFIFLLFFFVRKQFNFFLLTQVMYNTVNVFFCIKIILLRRVNDRSSFLHCCNRQKVTVYAPNEIPL